MFHKLSFLFPILFVMTNSVLAVELMASANSANNVTTASSDKNILVLIRSDKIIKNLNGENRIKDPIAIARSFPRACTAVLNKDYGAITQKTFSLFASEELKLHLAELANFNDFEIKTQQCNFQQVNQGLYIRTGINDLVLIQRGVLPLLLNGSDLERQYSILYEIEPDSVFAQIDLINASQQKQVEKLLDFEKEFDELAQTGSTLKIGSLAFGPPLQNNRQRASGNSNISVCTTTHEGDGTAAAILAYGFRGTSTQDPKFQEKAKQYQVTVNKNQPITKVYRSLEELYESIQKQTNECLIYVDLAANLNKINIAINRDKKFSISMGQLISSAELRDEWAKRQNYQSYSEYESIKIRNEKLIEEKKNEFIRLAQTKSNNKVGSLAFDVPKSAGNVAVCSVRNDGENSIALFSYAANVLESQSNIFQNNARSVEATADKNRPFGEDRRNLYASVEDLYAALKKQPNACLIYVDFPVNIVELSSKFAKDGKSFSMIGKLKSSFELRDDWAKRTGGYKDYVQYQTSREMGGATAEQLKQFNEYNINNKIEFMDVLQKMQSSRYAQGSNPSTVLDYLKDKSEAANKRGATAVSVRKARQDELQRSADKKEAETKRKLKEYTKEFPYIAVLTCGMPQHINIIPCFSGGRSGVDTELKIRNGDENTLFKAYNMSQAGQERRDGFYIDLRSRFNIRAQNSHGTLILGLKIIDRSTGKVLKNDQAARFELLTARN